MIFGIIAFGQIMTDQTERYIRLSWRFKLDKDWSLARL